MLSLMHLDKLAMLCCKDDSHAEGKLPTCARSLAWRLPDGATTAADRTPRVSTATLAGLEPTDSIINNTSPASHSAYACYTY